MAAPAFSKLLRHKSKFSADWVNSGMSAASFNWAVLHTSDVIELMADSEDTYNIHRQWEKNFSVYFFFDRCSCGSGSLKWVAINFTWTAICWSVQLYFSCKRAEVTVKLKARIPPSRKSDYRVLQIGLKACHIHWKYFPSYHIVQTSITILNSSQTSANRRLLVVQGRSKKIPIILLGQGQFITRETRNEQLFLILILINCIRSHDFWLFTYEMFLRVLSKRSVDLQRLILTPSVNCRLSF